MSKECSPVKRPKSAINNYAVQIPSHHKKNKFSSTQIVLLNTQSKLFDSFAKLPPRKRNSSYVMSGSRLSRNSPIKMNTQKSGTFNLFNLTINAPQEDCSLKDKQISELYKAKCLDLKIQYVFNQELKFHDYCKFHCKNRWISFKEVYILLYNNKFNRLV